MDRTEGDAHELVRLASKGWVRAHLHRSHDSVHTLAQSQDMDRTEGNAHELVHLASNGGVRAHLHKEYDSAHKSAQPQEQKGMPMNLCVWPAMAGFAPTCKRTGNSIGQFTMYQLFTGVGVGRDDAHERVRLAHDWPGAHQPALVGCKQLTAAQVCAVLQWL
jgi:hypothetical protein